MGTDKALLRLGDRAWWEIQLATLRAVGAAERYVVAPSPPAWLPSDFAWLADAPDGDGQGPLAGFAALGDRLQADRCLILGIDLPLLLPATLQSLLERQASAPGWIPVAGGKLQPFAACYPRDLLLETRDFLAVQNRRVMALVARGLETGRIRKIAVERSAELEFLNANSPDMLQQLATSYDQRLQ